MGEEVLVVHQANGAVAAVHHVLRHVQCVHRHHRHQLPAGVHVPRGNRPGPEVLHRHTAHTAGVAQLRAQPQVLGARVHGGQPADGRRSGHHVLLFDV